MALFSFSPSAGLTSSAFRILLVSTLGVSLSDTIAVVSNFLTGVSGYARSGISAGSKSPASSLVFGSSVTFSVAGASFAVTSSLRVVATSLTSLTASTFSFSLSVTFFA